MKCGSTFALTLTLSPEEREQQLSAFRFSDAHPANPVVGIRQRRRTILPLPAGEGRGEGEPRVRPNASLDVWLLLLLCLLCFVSPTFAQSTVGNWGLFEVTLKGPTNGNPFLDVSFTARFAQGYDSIEVPGFYDGDGNYRVRFMPEKQGAWKYETVSGTPELNGKAGEFTVTKPVAGNHGPVHVTNTFHFAYADGTPFKQLGTTCYVWTHQPESLQEQTLKTLAASPFNKIRFCVFPKRYTWNTNEPTVYPFEGKPRNFDTARFNPKFFQHF